MAIRLDVYPFNADISIENAIRDESFFYQLGGGGGGGYVFMWFTKFFTTPTIPLEKKSRPPLDLWPPNSQYSSPQTQSFILL